MAFFDVLEGAEPYPPTPMAATNSSDDDSRSCGPAAGVVDWRAGAPLPADRATTIPELVARCVAAHGDATVLLDEGRRCSWRDLDAWSSRLASALAEHLPAGERLAILAPNGAAHLVVELAAWRLGAIAAPVFTGFGDARLRELMSELAPRAALVADAAHVRLLPAGCLAFAPERLWELATRPATQSATAADRPVAADTACLILYTSGTSGSSGTPRGVVLSHDNVASQQAAFAMLWPEVGVGDRLASYLPWHHSFGSLAERLWALCRGATVTLVPGGGRDRQRFIDTMRAVRPTVFMSVPKIHALVIAEEVLDRSCLKWAFTAAAPLPEALFSWYAAAHVPVYEGWGLTECSPSAVITPPGSRHEPGVVGQPIPGVDVGVERGTGRILVRGPNVMLGYFKRESPCLARDGVRSVLDSGDLGAWTDAGLKLSGRADHVLKLANGEKASAAEIEAILHAHLAVHHAVVAVDGELIALIEPRHGHAGVEAVDAVRAYNAVQAEPFLRIARVHLVAEPWTIENGHITASMKVARGRVLQSWRSWRERGGGGFMVVDIRAG